LLIHNHNSNGEIQRSIQTLRPQGTNRATSYIPGSSLCPSSPNPGWIFESSYHLRLSLTII
jgi:hypothetical protein